MASSPDDSPRAQDCELRGVEHRGPAGLRRGTALALLGYRNHVSD
jgi:hypothetical protein